MGAENAMLFNTRREEHLFFSSLKAAAAEPPEIRGRGPDGEYAAPFWLVKFGELVQNIKETHGSVKNVIHRLKDKTTDPDFADQANQSIAEDLDRVDALAHCFLDYLRINTFPPKRNTVHLLLEEVLRANGNRLTEKDIRIFKKQYEKDLPETVVQDEQLKVMLSSLLLYAVSLIPPNGGIGFLTKLIRPQPLGRNGNGVPETDEKYIEILYAFSSPEKGEGEWEKALGTPSVHNGDKASFLLRIVEEMVRKNRGTLRIKVGEDEAITLISLILPVERRKTFYREPAERPIDERSIDIRRERKQP